jgi:hypothetical protein
VLSNQSEKKTAEIGRSAWSLVVATLARFEIVEIRVAPPSKSAAASSSSTAPVVEPPPYISESDWDMKESQLTVVSNGPQISRSTSRTPSLASRVSGFFTPKSS